MRPVTSDDIGEWERMRRALWPSEPDEHAREVEKFFTGALHEPLAVLLAFDERGDTLGTEFGSDALIDNATSAAAHRALGFNETEQIRCFRKDL